MIIIISTKLTPPEILGDFRKPVCLPCLVFTRDLLLWLGVRWVPASAIKETTPAHRPAKGVGKVTSLVSGVNRVGKIPP